MRRWASMLGPLAILALPAMVYAGTPTIDYTLTGTQGGGGWFVSPVILKWQVGGESSSSGCDTQYLNHDTAGANFVCSATGIGGGKASQPVTIKIDMTPPTITSASPARSPDHNGWWNRPVAFAFAGSDALSGARGCDTVTYSGPGGPAAQVVGGCHDIAGNYAVRGFPLNFDATPPQLVSVKAIPSSRSTTLAWTTSPDVVLVRVMRAVGSKSARPKVVYSGRGARFTDSGLKNGTTYRYTVKAFDQAGNATSKGTRSTPRLSLGLRPRRGARFRRPPRLRWPRIRGSDYYNVQLYRGSRKILTAWPAGAHLKLHRHWTFGGQRFRLSPGHYRWYVWPGRGSRAAHRYGAFIGQSSFVIVRR